MTPTLAAPLPPLGCRLPLPWLPTAARRPPSPTTAPATPRPASGTGGLRNWLFSVLNAVTGVLPMPRVKPAHIQAPASPRAEAPAVLLVLLPGAQLGPKDYDALLAALQVGAADACRVVRVAAAAAAAAAAPASSPGPCRHATPLPSPRHHRRVQAATRTCMWRCLYRSGSTSSAWGKWLKRGAMGDGRAACKGGCVDMFPLFRHVLRKRGK